MKFTDLLDQKPIVFILFSGGIVVAIALAILFALKTSLSASKPVGAVEKGISSTLSSEGMVSRGEDSSNATYTVISEQKTNLNIFCG